MRAAYLDSSLPLGEQAIARGREVLSRLDAIHLATAQLLGEDVGQLITYDNRMAEAAERLGLKAVAPQ